MENKFKGSLLGFNKKNVNDYIIELTNEMAKRIAKKDEKIAKLNEQIEALKEQIRGFELERAVVSDAIIKAKNQAELIISDAISESQNYKAQLLSEIAKEKENLATAKNEVWELKKNTLAIVEDYKRQLEELK